MGVWSGAEYEALETLRESQRSTEKGYYYSRKTYKSRLVMQRVLNK